MFKEFFYLHKSDRQVILALLTVAAVAIAVIFLAGGKEPKSNLSTPILADSIDKNNAKSQTESIIYSQPDAVTPERFAFDPNTADSTQLLRLGLHPFQVKNIYKYRAAGGVFHKKEDFARLYGLTVKQYRELEPYIQISADYLPASTLFPRTSHEPYATQSQDSGTFVPRYPVKLTEGETIDLATADTTTLRCVPGIGSYFARRIVEYGQRLGGYVSVAQLDEIDDFPQEAKPYITLSYAHVVTKLNINTLSLNELKRHPYINYYQAQEIINYRRQYGPITDLQDLHLLPDFPPEAISRLQPYVEY